MANSKYLSVPAELLPLIEKRDAEVDRRTKDRRSRKTSNRSSAVSDRRIGSDHRMKQRRKPNKK